MIVLVILLIGYIGARRAHWRGGPSLAWAAGCLLVAAALAGHGTLGDLSSLARSFLR